MEVSNFCYTIDHRYFDGSYGAKILNRFTELLKNFNADQLLGRISDENKKHDWITVLDKLSKKLNL